MDPNDPWVKVDEKEEATRGRKYKGGKSIETTEINRKTGRISRNKGDGAKLQSNERERVKESPIV